VVVVEVLVVLREMIQVRAARIAKAPRPRVGAKVTASPATLDRDRADKKAVPETRPNR
jgi:hypothetical protein